MCVLFSERSEDAASYYERACAADIQCPTMYSGEGQIIAMIEKTAVPLRRLKWHIAVESTSEDPAKRELESHLHKCVHRAVDNY